ncbi:MAG: hypothetical protein ACI9F9_003365 [Candidatus Paceibacteria bacterium]|jgi:hypothetical protein
MLNISLVVLLIPLLGPALLDSKRDAGWRSDLDYLVTEARRVHAGSERPAFSPQFEERVGDLQLAISELSDDQILAQMQKLIAILSDGHSAVYGVGPNSPLEFESRVLPLKFYLFPSGLHIVGGSGEWVDLAGSLAWFW